MSYQLWSWVLGAVGLFGFIMAGKKVWWCWYVNIFNQLLWLIYSLVSGQYGFLVATAGYTIVFVKNAISWTREKDGPKEVIAPIGHVTYMHSDEMGMMFEGVLNPEHKEILRYGDLLGVSIFKSPEIDLTPRFHWRKLSPLHIWRTHNIKQQFRAAQKNTWSYPVPLYSETHVGPADFEDRGDTRAIITEEMKEK